MVKYDMENRLDSNRRRTSQETLTRGVETKKISSFAVDCSVDKIQAELGRTVKSDYHHLT